MKYFVISIVIIVGFYSKFSFAGKMYTECSTCTSEIAFESKAMFKALENGNARNDVTVVNYYTRQHKKYRVTNVRGEMGTPPDVSTQPLTPTTEEIERINKVTDAFHASLIQAYDIAIPANVANSAYDLVGSSSHKNAVMSYAKDNGSFVDLLQGEVFLLMDLFGLTDGEPYVIQLTFADGSEAKIIWDKFAHNGVLDGEFAELIDMENNTIALTEDDIETDTVRFSNADNADNYRDAMARIGFTTNNNSGGSSSGGSSSLTCTVKKTKDKITLTCKFN